MSISWHINYPAEYSLRLYCIFWVRECPRVLCQRWRLLLTNLIADDVRHRLLYYNLASVCAFWVLGNRNQTLIINNKNVSICETFMESLVLRQKAEIWTLAGACDISQLGLSWVRVMARYSNVSGV